MDNKIKKKINQALTVKDLIEFLKTIPENTPIGSKGHFGQIELFDKDDLPHISKGYITASYSWRDVTREYDVEFVQLPYIDPGPIPD